MKDKILKHGKRFFEHALKYINCEVNYNNAPLENLIAGKYYAETLKSLLTEEQKIVTLINNEINKKIIKKITELEKKNE